MRCLHRVFRFCVRVASCHTPLPTVGSAEQEAHGMRRRASDGRWKGLLDRNDHSFLLFSLMTLQFSRLNRFNRYFA